MSLQLSLSSCCWVWSVLLTHHWFELPLLLSLLSFSSSLKLGVDQGIQLAFGLLLFTSCRQLSWFFIKSFVRSAASGSLIQERWTHPPSAGSLEPGSVIVFKWLSRHSRVSCVRVPCVPISKIVVRAPVPLVRLTSCSRLVLGLFFDVDFASVSEIPARSQLLEHAAAFGVLSS